MRYLFVVIFLVPLLAASGCYEPDFEGDSDDDFEGDVSYFDADAGADMPSDTGTNQGCGLNFHVTSGECVACEASATRPAGDDPTKGDTACLSIGPPCSENFHVADGVCVACDAGSTREPGDDPAAGDTSCVPDPSGSPCSASELKIWDDPSVGPPKNICHRIPDGPEGLYFNSGHCSILNSDGTGAGDSLGGYDTSWSSGPRSDRESSLYDFYWGAEVNTDGDFVRDSNGDLVIYFVDKTTGDLVNITRFQEESIFDTTTGSFLPSSALVSTLPADARSAACYYFPNQTCTSLRIDPPIGDCFENGLLNGPSSSGRVSGGEVISTLTGQHTDNVRSGTWTETAFRNGNIFEVKKLIYPAVVVSEREYFLETYRPDVNDNLELVSKGEIVSSRRKEGLWEYYFRLADVDHAGKPMNAVGTLKQSRNYLSDASVGLTTDMYVRYDIPRPALPGDLPAYFANRVAIGTCDQTARDVDNNTSVTYHYGADGCGDDTCNAGLTQTKTTDAAGVSTCTDPSGSPVTCFTTYCTPH